MAELTSVSIGALARRSLLAESRAGGSSRASALIHDADGLNEAYERAIKDASDEDLVLAWEFARRGQCAFEIGSADWLQARRVTDLLGAECRARARS